MIRTVDGGRAVEFDGELHYVEANLNGRETIRELSGTLALELFEARRLGRNNYSADTIRRMAYEKARRLVAEKAAQHEQKPLR